MIKVIILGFGNVGQHLYTALSKSSEVEITQIYNRSQIKFPQGLHTNFTADIDKTMEADIYIIAVPDDHIKAISENIPVVAKLVVHTSGSVPMEELSSQNRKGVFYPLQTFSKDKTVNFSEIPICLEAENKDDLELLHRLGEAISENVKEINSEERSQLHLAAVFVNNFVNYLYQVGSDLLLEDSLSFDLLKPLIQETAKKIETLHPAEAQTGPAKRNDLKTIENHLHLLSGNPYKELYEKMTKAIQNKNKNPNLS